MKGYDEIRKVGSYNVGKSDDCYVIEHVSGKWSMKVGEGSPVWLLCDEGMRNPEGDGFANMLSLLQFFSGQIVMQDEAMRKAVADLFEQCEKRMGIQYGRPCCVYGSKEELVVSVLHSLIALNVWLDEDEVKSLESLLESNYVRKSGVYSPDIGGESDDRLLAEEAIVREELDKLKS